MGHNTLSGLSGVEAKIAVKVFFLLGMSSSSNISTYCNGDGSSTQNVIFNNGAPLRLFTVTLYRLGPPPYCTALYMKILHLPEYTCPAIL